MDGDLPRISEVDGLVGSCSGTARMDNIQKKTNISVVTRSSSSTQKESSKERGLKTRVYKEVDHTRGGWCGDPLRVTVRCCMAVVMYFQRPSSFATFSENDTSTSPRLQSAR